MCKFCEGELKLITNCATFGAEIKNRKIEVDYTPYRMNNSVNIQEVVIDIFFCPMCGRKLLNNSNLIE